jgi:hypothetical protein
MEAPWQIVWEDCFYLTKLKLKLKGPPLKWESIVKDTWETIVNAEDDLIKNAIDNGTYQELFPKLALTLAILEQQQDAKIN